MPRVFIFKYKVQEWDLVGNYVLGVLVTWLALPPAAGLPLRGVLAAALLAVGHCRHRCVSKGSTQCRNTECFQRPFYGEMSWVV